MQKERDYFYTKYNFADIFADFKRAPDEIMSQLREIPGVEVIEGGLAFASGWGERKIIHAKVSKVSKAGFLKTSALGVEEERTEVLMEPMDLSSADLSKLGNTFHTQITLQVSKLDSVLKIPTGALVRDGSAWAVFQIVNGKAKLTQVEPGLRNNEEVVILSGLQAGDLMINYPGDLVKEGASVSAP